MSSNLKLLEVVNSNSKPVIVVSQLVWYTSDNPSHEEVTQG
jgi:hypothetical protein